MCGILPPCPGHPLREQPDRVGNLPEPCPHNPPLRFIWSGGKPSRQLRNLCLINPSRPFSYSGHLASVPLVASVLSFAKRHGALRNNNPGLRKSALSFDDAPRQTHSPLTRALCGTTVRGFDMNCAIRGKARKRIVHHRLAESLQNGRQVLFAFAPSNSTPASSLGLPMRHHINVCWALRQEPRRPCWKVINSPAQPHQPLKPEGNIEAIH